MTTNILTNKNIPFEYKLFDSLSQEDQDKYLNIAKNVNQTSFPIIFKDDKIVTLQQI
jgi:glutaredoxin